MANPNMRVKIPRNPQRRIALAASIYKKHLADGVKSPLQTLSDYNWTDNGPKITEAEDLELQAKQLEKDVEELYRQRDLLLEPITLTIRSSRDNLLGIYQANYKKLGDWGFVVDDTPRAKKPTDTK